MHDVKVKVTHGVMVKVIVLVLDRNWFHATIYCKDNLWLDNNKLIDANVTSQNLVMYSSCNVNFALNLEIKMNPSKISFKYCTLQNFAFNSLRPSDAYMRR